MNLTKEPILGLIATLGVPAATAMMFNTLYNVTGTFFAGMISTNAVAGMSMSFLLYLSIVGMGLGFGSSLTALIGNSLGAKKQFMAKIYAAKGVVFVLLFALTMASFGSLFASNLLKFLGANDEFMNEAVEFISVIFIASPFFLLIKALNGILVALGDTKTLRNWLFIGVFINATFCFLFVKIFYLGVAGIALATALVQFLGTIYLLFKVRKTEIFDFSDLRIFLPDFRIYAKISKQAIPACLNYLSMSLGGLVLLKFISFYGTTAVAGYGIALRIEQLVTLPTVGIAAAVLTIISRNFGAKNYTRVRECYLISLKILFFYCIFACAFCVFCGTYLISLFDANTDVVAIGQSYLMINSFAYFGYGILNISGSALQAIKKPMMPFLLNVLRQLILQVSIYYIIVFVLLKPLKFIWIGMFANVYFIGIWITLYTIFRINKFLNKTKI